MLRISLHCSVVLLVFASLLVQGLPRSDADVAQPKTVEIAPNISIEIQPSSTTPASKVDVTVAKNNDTLQLNATQNNATQAITPAPNATSVLGQADDPANPSQNESATSTTEATSPNPTNTEPTESSSAASTITEPTEPTTTVSTTTTTQATASPSSTTTSTTAATVSTPTAETTKIEAETTTTTSAPPEQSPQASQPPEGMSSGIIAVVMAVVFAIVVIIVYAGLLLWRRYLEFRYGNRELLVNDLEFDTNDLRHFEL